MIDGIHEDLNRILVKPTWAHTPQEEEELEGLLVHISGEREWRAWRDRNDSIIVDYFQGQFCNRLECLTCREVNIVCYLLGVSYSILRCKRLLAVIY